MKIKILTYTVAFLLVGKVYAGENIKVVDGDSLEINGHSVRLIGIDAPEYIQLCQNADNQEYECGQKATAYLQKMISDGLARGEEVNCEMKGIDRYKRDLSICRCGAVNLNEEMVKAGWAVAYRHEMFTVAEKEAKKSKIGIWQGRFMRPELYRVLRRYSKM